MKKFILFLFLVVFNLGYSSTYIDGIKQQPEITGAVTSVNGETGDVILTQDNIIDGSIYVKTNNNFTDTEKTRLGSLTPTSIAFLDNANTFTKSQTIPAIKPSVDSTTAFQITKADGTTPILKIDSTNNRVNVGTVSLEAPFSVVSPTTTTIDTTTDIVSRFFSYTTPTFGAGIGATITLGGAVNAGTAVRDYASISGVKENATSNDPSGNLVFKTRKADSTLNEAMRISSNGNVTMSGYLTTKKSGVFGYISTPSATTITTAGTYYPVQGEFVNILEDFGSATVNTPGIKYNGTLTRYFEIDLHAQVEANSLNTDVSIAVYKNGELCTFPAITTVCRDANSPYAISLTAVIELAQNDEIQLMTTSDGNGDRLTFINLQTTIRPFF